MLTVLKTVCPKGRVGSNPTLSVRFQQIVLRSMAVDGILQIQSRDCHIGKCESAHGEVPKMAEGTPLERVQGFCPGAPAASHEKLSAGLSPKFQFICFFHTDLHFAGALR